jgi:hypothetical protein
MARLMEFENKKVTFIIKHTTVKPLSISFEGTGKNKQ